ncbi:Phosphoenolpyruvate/pyruvate domain-containing protein [Sistotremastrum niveocremeum HHB9708]|uniref:Phosphoenolpyruvate/pyruvate domain-containing protein n=1 Tax=Sistotremastrum niveocremeum HHB9708 TaxID=1314777 RepID=A0A164PEM9_9AGAM|nr:Phosphoenolpyruvate/pyruvate domain-containing protein [Sistotremastrum niveocremeum HHB9708]
MSHPLLSLLKSRTISSAGARSGKAAFGAWQTLPGIFFSRTLAAASEHLSWICLDCEHGLIPLQGGVAECITAINSVSSGIAPGRKEAPSVLVRIPATGVSTGTGWQIKIALDAGARGVIVPMVNNAAKAKEIVQDAKFPPAGRRGYGNPFTHTLWDQSFTDYIKQANDNILVMVQIETKEAVENVEEIAAVPGVDVLFIGPFDLSLSLGFPPPSPDPHPEVEQVITRIREAAHKNGKYCAFYCGTGSQANQRANEGFDIVSVISDVGAMSEGVSKNLATAAGIEGGSRPAGY